MAEGARLLIECGVKSFTEGSNPSVSAFAPLAQLDRASGYGPEGQEFESLRVYSLKNAPAKGHLSFLRLSKVSDSIHKEIHVTRN